METIQEGASQGIETLDDLQQLFVSLFYKVSRTADYLIVETEQLYVVVSTQSDYVSFRVNATISADLDEETMRELADKANLRWRMVRFDVGPSAMYR